MLDFREGWELERWGVKVLEGLGFWGVSLEMDENSELEEGEACYYKDDDDNINPDTAFSYIVRVWFLLFLFQ